MNWISKLNIVEAALIGMYAAIVPACYILVKMSESGFSAMEIMWSFYWLFGGPAFTLMLFNRLAVGMKEESELINRGKR